MTSTGLGLTVVAAAAPVAVYVGVVWWLDRYEREPAWLVLLTLLYGAVGAILLAILLSLVVGTAFTELTPTIEGVVIAPLVEEPSKGLILVLLLLTRQFDDTVDGVVYGAAAGLGFAMTENFFYFVGAHEAGGVDTWASLIVTRGLFTASMHSAATASFGAVLGWLRYRGAALQWLVGPLLGLVPAVAMHAAFNGALVAADTTGDSAYAAVAFLLVPIAGAVLLTVTLSALHAEHVALARELREEAASGLIPAPHAEILPFYRKRWRRGWLDPGVKRRRYIHATTVLAFRKRQLRRAGGPRRELEADVARLREEIAALLARR